MSLDTHIKRLTKFADGGLEDIVHKNVNEQTPLMEQLNRDQLEDGDLSNGGHLPAYSPTTVQIKRAKGQQTQPMNLRDKGDFHAGILAAKYNGYIEMTSRDSKTRLLLERFGEFIFGLTPENIGKVADAARPGMDEDVSKFFQ